MFDNTTSIGSPVVVPQEPFIFVRHGSTDWSIESIYQGPQDLSLNEQGKAQAALIADILMTAKKDTDLPYIMITSNLKRAVDTSRIIADKMHISVFLEQGLQERYYGNFSSEVKIQSNCLQIPADAESTDAFQHRIFTVVHKIFTDEKTKNNRKILVSHGEVFKYLAKLLTKQETTIPRGGVVMFVPICNPNGEVSWSIHNLKPENSYST